MALKRTGRWAAVTLLASCLTTSVWAQASPVGDWDLSIHGRARGIAQLTFNPDGTIVGQTHIETRKGATKVSSTPDENLRGGDGKRGSSDDAADTDPPAPAAVTNFYGAATVDGLWSFDISGRLIGFLNLGSFVITSTSTNATTNSFSFRGRARGGSRPRLTMMVEGVLGRSTYRGVPLTTLTDISGDYRVTGRRGNNSVVELFTLTAAGMNNYLVSGSGLGFGYSGEAILSARRKLSLVTSSEGTNRFVLTFGVGPYNTNRSRGNLNGRDTDGRVRLRVFQ